jgi:hypothetical protein
MIEVRCASAHCWRTPLLSRFSAITQTRCWQATTRSAACASRPCSLAQSPAPTKLSYHYRQNRAAPQRFCSWLYPSHGTSRNFHSEAQFARTRNMAASDRDILPDKCVEAFAISCLLSIDMHIASHRHIIPCLCMTWSMEALSPSRALLP